MYTGKEDYEIDPNSSFNKLRKLQMTLKEEAALIDIYYENRDDLLKKIEENCLEYFKQRIAIQEIFDHGNQKIFKSGNTKLIKYKVSDKPSSELPQSYDALYKLMFYFRESNNLTMKLIEHCPKDNYDQLANFICNYYYVNIFSSTFLNESLLTLIYLLLDKEIDKLKNENSILSFLDPSQSFIASTLRCLSRKDEVKTYLEKILKSLLTKTSGLLNNQKNPKFIGLDLNKIKNYLRDLKYQFSRTDKSIESISYLLSSDISKSKLEFLDNIINIEPEEIDPNK